MRPADARPEDSASLTSDGSTTQARSLRRRAEEKARKTPEAPGARSPKGAQQLLHELQVHQIELEMQNEELRRAQSQIQASRARYFDLYNLAPTGYLTLDDKGTILDANLCAVRLLGVEKRALVGKPLSRFILPEDQDIHYRHRKELWKTSVPQVFEMRMLRASAPPFWARVEATTGADPDGEPLHRMVLSDITESRRRQAQTAWLATFPQLSPNPIAEADREGRLHFINPAALKLFPDLELRQSDHPWLADWEAVVRRLGQGAEETLVREVAAGERWYQQTLTWVHETGRVRIYGADVTGLKRAEDEARRREELLTLFVSNAPAAIAMLDREMRYLRVSRRWMTDNHLGERDITGLSHYEVFPHIPERWKETHRRCLAGAAERSEEDELVRPDGSTDWLRWEILPWYARPGEVGGLLIFSESITERKRFEADLRQAREKTALQARFPEENPNPVLRVSAEGLVLYANPASLKAPGWGQKPGQPLGEPLRSALDRAFAQRGALHEDVPLDRRCYAVSFVPMVDAGYANVYGRDITAHREAEEALQRQADMLNLSHEAIFAWELDGGILAWNQGAERLYGFSGTETSGCISRELLRTEFPVDYDRVRDVLRQEGTWSGELTQHAKDGRALTTESRLQLIQEASGRWIVLETDHDITERKRMESDLRRNHEMLGQHVTQRTEQLRLSLDRLRLIADNISEVFWMADARLERMLYVSPNYRKIWGAVSQEIEECPRTILESIHPEDRPRVEQWLSGLCKGGAREATYRVVWPDGTIRHVRHSGLPVPGEDGAASAFVGVAQDVTERVNAEEEKARLASQYQQAQKMEAVGLLAGGIAHDFGNVLACIVGNNYFLLEGLKPGHRLRPFSLEIKHSVEVAATLTHQLLGVSGNRVVRQSTILDPNSVILAMAKMLHRLLGEKIEIHQDLHSSIWPVKMDSGQLEQIILNLAVNARDAMPQGGRLTLATKNLVVQKDGSPPEQTALPPGRYVLLEVRDTGAGMDAAVQARIFEPFFTTKGFGRGTGLGLATVKGILQEYHGGISVESEPGRGTAFRVYLPSVKGGAKAMHRGHVVKKSRGGDETILVVEDNGTLIDVLKKTLHGGGYSVISARTAEDAVSQGARIKERVDVLLTDVVLPGMDGVDLAKHLKELWPGLRVIYMSGYPGNALAPIAGFGDCVFLEKPFSPQKLLDTLRQVLDVSQGGLF